VPADLLAQLLSLVSGDSHPHSINQPSARVAGSVELLAKRQPSSSSALAKRQKVWRCRLSTVRMSRIYPMTPATPANLDLIAARAGVQQANTSLTLAQKRRRAATIGTIYRRIRLWAARLGLPVWLASLVAASLLAFALAIPAILLGASVGLLFLGIILSYLIPGAAIFSLLRDGAGETDENRVATRDSALRGAVARGVEAMTEWALAKGALAAALQKVAAIEAILRSDAHRRQVNESRILAIDPGRLYPDEFERYAGDIFRHLGYHVEVTGQSGDQGMDLLACKGATRIAVQAKRYTGSVGNTAVQEAYAGQAHHRCHRCMVITSGTFTKGAIDLAVSTGCILIGKDEIPALVRGQINLGC